MNVTETEGRQAKMPLWLEGCHTEPGRIKKSPEQRLEHILIKTTGERALSPRGRSRHSQGVDAFGTRGPKAKCQTIPNTRTQTLVV